MAENPLGDFFITDLDDETILDPSLGAAPQITVPAQPAEKTEEPAAVTLPAATALPAPVLPAETAATTVPEPAAVSVGGESEDAAAPEPVAETSTPETAPAAAPAPAARSTRELQLAAALDRLMMDSPQIDAAALVSLDGFTMAAALPEGMHEDRVGAMSAAILGLGERAAAELGKGKLSQVFIEGAEGYVVLMAAGTGAVLTCLAGTEAKLGLLLYDMRAAAASIAELLG